MIVMKFGGVSLASATSIGRVVEIVRSEISRQPVIVTSAIGRTTDTLLEMLAAARRSDSYSVWKLQEKLKNHHFAVSEQILHGGQLSPMHEFMRIIFRDLQVRMVELSEGERVFNPELQDWTVSLGEQLSSRLLAAVLEERCGNTSHLDMRKLMLTNDEFTNAQPLYWETYARIRWAVPVAAQQGLVVLGGFMGSTEDGRTTTLGRGGSDLTASIVGAALNSDEIQVWKDVNGMLTCDPRLRKGGHQVKTLSYEEATELANAGTTILHPETMVPAQRLRIPIVIRNAFFPAREGTTIHSSMIDRSTLVKSIAVKNNITLLEVRAINREDSLEPFIAFCREHSSAATVLCSSERAVYIAVNEESKIPEDAPAPDNGLDVRVRSGQALLTLVGRISDRRAVLDRLTTALQGLPAFIVPNEESPYSVRVAVPKSEVRKCLDLLHREFFSNPDPGFFVVENTNGTRPKTAAGLPLSYSVRPRSFTLDAKLLLPN